MGEGRTGGADKNEDVDKDVNDACLWYWRR
jgi:hypothetical protein